MVFIARTRSRSTFPPPVETRAMVFHLFRIPPPADSKDDAPVRQAVEGSHDFLRFSDSAQPMPSEMLERLLRCGSEASGRHHDTPQLRRNLFEPRFDKM